LYFYQGLLAGPSHRTLQVVVGRYPDGILHAPLFERFVNLRLGKGRVGPERNFLVHPLLPLDLWHQQLFPALRTVNVARTELGR